VRPHAPQLFAKGKRDAGSDAPAKVPRSLHETDINHQTGDGMVVFLYPEGGEKCG